VRRIASELRPGLLDDLGLVAAIEWQSEEFEKRSGIKTHFSSTVNDVGIPARLATAFFRIFQESLTNVARHAQAHEIIATLEQRNDKLVLQIKDDGKGFDAKEIENKKTLGLLGMKERTMMMGGKYEINSRPGKGTTVTVSVSLAKSNGKEVKNK
jgi:signal transduction histidine kinase